MQKRKLQMEGADFDSFISANLDLLDGNALKGWYTKERLNSPAACHQFLMPDKVAGEPALPGDRSGSVTARPARCCLPTNEWWPDQAAGEASIRCIESYFLQHIAFQRS